VLVLGYLWMLPGPYARLSADVFASAAFAANIAPMLRSSQEWTPDSKGY